MENLIRPLLYFFSSTLEKERERDEVRARSKCKEDICFVRRYTLPITQQCSISRAITAVPYTENVSDVDPELDPVGSAFISIRIRMRPMRIHITGKCDVELL